MHCLEYFLIIRELTWKTEFSVLGQILKLFSGNDFEYYLKNTGVQPRVYKQSHMVQTTCPEARGISSSVPPEYQSWKSRLSLRDLWMELSGVESDSIYLWFIFSKRGKSTIWFICLRNDSKFGTDLDAVCASKCHDPRRALSINITSHIGVVIFWV